MCRRQGHSTAWWLTAEAGTTARLTPLDLASMFRTFCAAIHGLAALAFVSGWNCDVSEQHGLEHIGLLQQSMRLVERRHSDAGSTYTLFVKFHKVAGTTWRDYVDHITGVSSNCSNQCGIPHWECRMSFATNPIVAKLCELDVDARVRDCDEHLRSCTFHQSLAVIRQAVSGRNLTAKSSDLAALQSLGFACPRLVLFGSWNTYTHTSDVQPRVHSVKRPPMRKL